MPAYTYGGEILKLPATLPHKPLRAPGGDLTIASVWFSGATGEPNDSNNATRWIDDFKYAYPGVAADTLGLRLVASSENVTEAIARERANKVEALVRDKLGAAARITIVIEPVSWEGDVRITLDEAEFLRFMAAR